MTVSQACCYAHARAGAPCRHTRPYRRPLLVTIQNLYRDPSPYRSRTARRVARTTRARRVCGSAPAPCRRALLRRIAICIAAPIATNRPPQPPYNFCIATPPLAKPRARCRTPLRASRLCRACGWPYCGRARPCRAPILACPGLRACSACCVPAQPAVCLLSQLCACSACCVPAQPAVCHNTVEPAVCLPSLLCATIQLSLLCACSACCVPQYN